MPRVRKGAARRQKHKKVLKSMRGYYGVTSRRYRLALQKSFKSGVYATRDRRERKRNFRALWITRVTAACRMRGIRYSQLIHGLELANVTINRKMLSEVAIADPAAFDAIVAKAVAALPEAMKPKALAASA